MKLPNVSRRYCWQDDVTAAVSGHAAISSYVQHCGKSSCVTFDLLVSEPIHKTRQQHREMALMVFDLSS